MPFRIVRLLNRLILRTVRARALTAVRSLVGKILVMLGAMQRHHCGCRAALRAGVCGLDSRRAPNSSRAIRGRSGVRSYFNRREVLGRILIVLAARFAQHVDHCGLALERWRRLGSRADVIDDARRCERDNNDGDTQQIA